MRKKSVYIVVSALLLISIVLVSQKNKLGKFLGEPNLIVTITDEKYYAEDFMPKDELKREKREKMSSGEFKEWVERYKYSKFYDLLETKLRTKYKEEKGITSSDTEVSNMQEIAIETFKKDPNFTKNEKQEMINFVKQNPSFAKKIVDMNKVNESLSKNQGVDFDKAIKQFAKTKSKEGYLTIHYAPYREKFWHDLDA